MSKLNVLWCFAFQGMNDGLVAPTMVDLELVTGGTPESVSVMFSLRALFIVLGSVVSGKIIQKRPRKRPLLNISPIHWSHHSR